MKSEEIEADQVTETFVAHKDSLSVCHFNQVETFVSHKDSLTVCGKASHFEKPKKNSNIAMVSSILKDYIDLFIPENADTNIIETEGEEEIILTTKKNISSKTLTIQDDKYSGSVASVSYDLAQLLDAASQNYF